MFGQGKCRETTPIPNFYRRQDSNTLAKMKSPDVPASVPKKAVVGKTDDKNVSSASSYVDDNSDTDGDEDEEEEAEETGKKQGKKRKRKKALAQEKKFEDLNLSRTLLKSGGALEWAKPTPV